MDDDLGRRPVPRPSARRTSLGRQAGEGVRELLPAVLAFVEESGPELLKELAVQMGKEFPVVRGLLAAAEKLADEAAQRRVEEMLANVEAMTLCGQVDLRTLRDDADLLIALSVVMYARQGELLKRLHGPGPILSHSLTDSAIELALAAHRAKLVLEYQYADHRGIADSASLQHIASLPLDAIYVGPRLSNERSDTPSHEREREMVRLLTDASLENLPPARRRHLEEEYAALSGRRWKIASDKSLGESLGAVLAKHRRLVVLGVPGAGKSTLIRFLARTSALGVDSMNRRLGWAEDSIPVVISLAAYSAARRERPSLELRSYLDAEMERRGGAALREGIAREFSAGRLMLLLDGVDEEPDSHHRAAMVQALDSLLEAAGDWRCVVTSRPHGYIRLRGDVAHYALLPFSPEHMETFVRSWHVALEHRRHPDTPNLAVAEAEAVSLLEEIRRDSRIESLAANPLMLVVISLIRQERVRLPQRRVLLYERAVKTLMDTWNDWRTSPAVDAGGAVLPYERMLRVWAAAARWMHQERPTGIVHRVELRLVLVDFLRQHDDSADPELTAESYLNAATHQAGLLEERATNVFGFWHPTFQEFLAAVDLATPTRSLTQRVLPLRDDPHWREVILLAIAYVGVVLHDSETASEAVQAITQAGPPLGVEPILATRLGLAAACLAENVGLRRGVANEIIRQLINVTREQPYHPLNQLFVNTIRAVPQFAPTPDTVDALASLVGHADWQVRMETARLLANCSASHSRALELCDVMAHDDDNEVRCHAALGLARAGQVGEHIWYALTGADEKRLHLGAAIKDYIAGCSTRAIGSLLALWGDSSLRRPPPVVRLLQLGHRADPAVIDTARMLIHSGSDRQYEAAALLIRLDKADETVIEVLRRGMETNDWRASAAIWVVARARYGDDRIAEGLDGCLDSSSLSVRLAAAEALIALERQNDKVVATLHAGMQADIASRPRSAQVLMRMGIYVESVVVNLIPCLGHLVYGSDAAVLLAEAARSNPSMADVLYRELRSADSLTRHEVARALIRLGRPDSRLEELLLDDLKSAEIAVKYGAATLLTRIGHSGEQVVSAFRFALADPSLRLDAARTLIRMNRADDSVVTVLRRDLADPDLTARLSPAELLITMGIDDESVVESLRPLLYDDDSLLKWAAVKCLSGARHVDESLQAALATNVSDENPDLRYEAARLLSSLPGGSMGMYRAVVKSLATTAGWSAPRLRTVSAGQREFLIRCVVEVVQEEKGLPQTAIERLVRLEALSEEDGNELAALTRQGPHDSDGIRIAKERLFAWILEYLAEFR